jgi:hypothetical protein
MYQAINNATPEAYVTRKKSRAKIYQINNIFFNDGETFEIELFNPKTNRVLAKIWLNEQEISGSGIIINPGQRIFLERFIDSNNKFVYKTYDIESDKQSLEAIRNNGDIEIKFYNEYFNTNTFNDFPIFKPTIWYGTRQSNPYGSSISDISNGYYGNTTYTSNNVGFTSNSSQLKPLFGSLTTSISKSIETGRIEKGESSSQSFETSYGNFTSFSTKEVKYKILPMSSKPIEGKDLKKYCTECGKKVKDTFKFCPSCGTKV